MLWEFGQKGYKNEDFFYNNFSKNLHECYWDNFAPAIICWCTLEKIHISLGNCQVPTEISKAGIQRKRIIWCQSNFLKGQYGSTFVAPHWKLSKIFKVEKKVVFFKKFFKGQFGFKLYCIFIWTCCQFLQIICAFDKNSSYYSKKMLWVKLNYPWFIFFLNLRNELQVGTFETVFPKNI